MSNLKKYILALIIAFVVTIPIASVILTIVFDTVIFLIISTIIYFIVKLYSENYPCDGGSQTVSKNKIMVRKTSCKQLFVSSIEMSHSL